MASTSRSNIIADGWATWLNASARGFPSIGSVWTASRVNVPRQDLKDIGDALLCEVVPLPDAKFGFATRGQDQTDYPTGLILRQHYDAVADGTVDDTWLDLRKALVEDILKKTLRCDLLASPRVWAAEITQATVSSLDTLDIYQEFQAEAIVLFREIRDA